MRSAFLIAVSGIVGKVSNLCAVASKFPTERAFVPAQTPGAIGQRRSRATPFVYLEPFGSREMLIVLHGNAILASVALRVRTG